MKPSELATNLRRIAAAINNSRNPDRKLVARDLKKVLAAISSPVHTVQIDGKDITVEVLESDLKSDRKRSISGSFTVKLSDGRIVQAEGHWDNPWFGSDETPATMTETVTVDGVLLDSSDEDGAVIEIDDDSVTAEEIASAIVDAVQYVHES